MKRITTTAGWCNAGLSKLPQLNEIALFRHKSGLPFFDVLWLTHLPKVASLPVATSQEVKARLMDGRYDFDHVYYTESDQVCTVRTIIITGSIVIIVFPLLE